MTTARRWGMAPADPELPRWARVWPVLPYLFLLLPGVFAVLRDWQWPVLPLTLLAATAFWWISSGRAGSRLPVVVVSYFVLLLVAIGILVRLDEVFAIAGVGAFVQAFLLLPGAWAYGGVAATSAVLVVARPDTGRSPTEMLYSFLIAVLVASAIGLSVQTVADQNERRRVMVEQLTETSARLAALAQENAELQARLLTRARETGVLAERQRMAREIHDTIAQSLTAILTQLEVADGSLDDVAATRSRLATVRTLARDSLGEARRSIQALRPAPLEAAQLAGALREIAAKWSETEGVPAEVSVTGDARPLHAEVELTLLRVAQEALVNVARHAAAERVLLTLSYMEDVVALDIRDDGAGFTPGSPADGGFGLIAMRQRVTRLAGRFEIEAAPGRGTGISATVPAIPAGPDPAEPSDSADYSDSTELSNSTERSDPAGAR